MQKTTMPAHKVFLFSLLICFLFFSCCELSARIILALQNHSFTYMLYGFKDIRKFQTIPGKDGYSSYFKGIPSPDNKNPVNSMGFRGPDIKQNGQGSIRIVCLGSSTTFGDNHVYSNTYPALLQNRLDTIYGKDHCEVINAGMSGFDLNHIIALTKHDIMPLQPNIVLISNINNNFYAPGFWFVDRQGVRDDQKQPQPVIRRLFIKIKEFIINHCALGMYIQQMLLRGLQNYIYNFDWKSFGQALMVENNIWEAEYSNKMHRLLKIIFESNPDATVILLGEAVNSINFPEMGPPFAKAKKLLTSISTEYAHVYMLDMQDSIINAAQQGIEVWQDPTHAHDPLHLSRTGNEIMANTIAEFLAKSLSAN